MSSINPHSIRNRLLRDLLLGFGLLFVVSAWAIDQVVDRELYARFDGELLAIAKSLETLTLQEAHGVELHFADEVMQSFSAKKMPDYFELQFLNGEVLKRSVSLGKDHRLQPVQTRRSDLIFSNIILPSGRAGRMVQLRFHPGVGESMKRTRTMSQQQKPTIELRVARDIAVLTGVEYRLHLSLSIFVVTLLIFAGLAIWRRVGRELHALDLLADQARRIGLQHEEPAMSLSNVPLELVPLITRINESSAAIAQSLEREKRWSRDLAHELRTPITELKSMLEVEAAYPGTFSADKIHLESLQIAIEMDALVSALLLMSRIEGGLEQASHELTDLESLVQQILVMNKFANTKKITVEMGKFTRIKTDPALFKILLSNLIANATIHATPNTEVVLKTGRIGKIGYIEISNIATHLNQAELTQMTKRFWRKQISSEKLQGSGSGLGLSIASAVSNLLNLELNIYLSAEHVLQVQIKGFEIDN